MLVANEDAWTVSYLAARGTPHEKRNERWRHLDIKRALAQETDAKCAYCEGFVDDVVHPHVEHIIPRASKPDLAHRWHNLTTACGPCNTHKGAFYHETEGLLDPYQDDPSAHLAFHGSIVQWALGSQRGELTVKKLQLNRFGLMKQRAKRLQDVRELLERWHSAEEPLRTSLAEALRMDASEGEFSQSVTQLLMSYRFPIEKPAASETA
ncbi:HNH endonuclease [Terrabacter terrigena]